MLSYVYSVDVGVLEWVMVGDGMSLSVLAVEVQAMVDEGHILCRHVSNNGRTRAKGELYQIEMRTLSSATVYRSSNSILALTSPRSPLTFAASTKTSSGSTLLTSIIGISSGMGNQLPLHPRVPGILSLATLRLDPGWADEPGMVDNEECDTSLADLLSNQWLLLSVKRPALNFLMTLPDLNTLMLSGVDDEVEDRGCLGVNGECCCRSYSLLFPP